MKILIIILVSGYGLACLGAYLMQSRLVFFPDSEDAGNPGDVNLPFEDIVFAGANGRSLHGWFIPAADARYTLLYCHGNAGNITHRLESIQQLNRLGLSILIFDYGGYGRSSGRPTEQSVCADAAGAWNYLTDHQNLSSKDIILFGRSLGAAVAINLATEVEPIGIIVESAFTSLPELGARIYPWLPIKFLARYRFNNMDKIRDIRVPKLFVHSLEDEVVPYGMGKRLYNRAGRPKTFVRIRGSHNEGFLEPGSNYEKDIREFIDSLQDERNLRRRSDRS